MYNSFINLFHTYFKSRAKIVYNNTTSLIN